MMDETREERESIEEREEREKTAGAGPTSRPTSREEGSSPRAGAGGSASGEGEPSASGAGSGKDGDSAAHAGPEEHAGPGDGGGAGAPSPGEEEDPREKRKRELHRLTKKELEEKMLELEEKLAEAQAKAREYLEDAQRQKAELENYRKRMIREQTRIVEQANRHLIAGLLPVIDNLEKALEACGDREDPLAKGVRMVYEQFMDILRKEGLEEINPHGHPFDPAECEAVMTVVSDDHEDETVVEVHQKGYRYKGSLLRPARATVSKCEG